MNVNRKKVGIPQEFLCGRCGCFRSMHYPLGPFFEEDLCPRD